MTKTKLQTVLTVFLSSALLFVSCKQSDEEFLVYDADFLLTCVQLSWKDTRAVTNDNGQGSFSSGDRIEVLITGDKKTETIQLEYMDNRWTPALKRSDYASGGFTLSALYPVLTQNVDYPYCREVSIPVGQDDIDNYAAADILFAKTTVDAANTSATLQFNHALHRNKHKPERFYSGRLDDRSKKSCRWKDFFGRWNGDNRSLTRLCMDKTL